MKLISIIFTIMALVPFSIAQAKDKINFKLLDLQGNAHQLSDYSGKWIIVNYWATWCPPCLTEIPDLVKFHEQYHETSAVVIGVNTETDVSNDYLKEFTDTLLVNYPILRDTLDSMPLGNIKGLPTTFIITPEGKLVARQTGAISKKSLENYIKKRSGAHL